MYLLVLLCFVMTYIILSQLVKYHQVNKIPGPSTFELLKVFLFTKSNDDIYEYTISLFHTYGTVVRLWIKFMRPTLLVADRKYFQTILGSNQYLNRPPIYDLFATVCGDGLVGKKEEYVWKSERKILAPIFTTKNAMNNFKHLTHHVGELKTFLDSKENVVVDLQSSIKHFTLPINISYLLGEVVSYRDKIVSDIIDGLQKYQMIYLERAYSAIKQYDILFWLSPSYKPWISCSKIIHNIIDNLAENQSRKRSRHIADNKDCFEVLRENGFTKFSTLSHLKTILLAGFDTVAQVIGFTLYELAKRPDIQELLYKEYLSILKHNGEVDIKKLHNMIYTDSIIKECLRFYPPVPQLQRRLTSPVTIDGVVIPTGTDLIFSIFALHRSPEYFDEPDVFNPERFLPENIEKILPYSLAPFSLGLKDCIGKQLAMVQVKYVLAFIIGHYTIHSIEHKLELYTHVSMKSNSGIPVIFKRRT